MGIVGSVLSILTFSMKSITACCSGQLSEYLVNVVSGALQGSVLGKLLFHLYTSEHFPHWRISLLVMPMTPY